MLKIIKDQTICLTDEYDYVFSDVEGAKNMFELGKHQLVNCIIKPQGEKQNKVFIKIVNQEKWNDLEPICIDCTLQNSENVSHAIEIDKFIYGNS